MRDLESTKNKLEDLAVQSNSIVPNEEKNV
jgi:hypothetical protein